MIEYTKIRPMFTKIVTTARSYGRDQCGPGGVMVVATAGTVMPVQRVVAVGSSPAGIKVGDLVLINPKRYYRAEYDEKNSIREDIVQTMRHRAVYDVPRVSLNGEVHFLIETADVDCVVEEWDGDWEKDAEGGGKLSAGIGSGLIV